MSFWDYHSWDTFFEDKLKSWKTLSDSEFWHRMGTFMSWNFLASQWGWPWTNCYWEMSMNHISSVNRKSTGQHWPKCIFPTVLIISCVPLLTQLILICCSSDFLGDPLSLKSWVIKPFISIVMSLRKDQGFSDWQVIMNKWAISAPVALNSCAQTKTTMGISGGMKDEIQTQTRNHLHITALLNFHLCRLSDFTSVLHKLTGTH